MTDKKSKNLRSLLFTIMLISLSVSKVSLRKQQIDDFKIVDNSQCYIASADELIDILSSTSSNFNDAAIKDNSDFKTLIDVTTDLTGLFISAQKGSASADDSNAIFSKYKLFFAQMGAEDIFSKLPDLQTFDPDTLGGYIREIFGLFFQTIDSLSNKENRPFYFKEDFVRSIIYSNAANQLKKMDDKSVCVSPLELGNFDELYSDLNAETVELEPLDVTTLSITPQEISKGKLSFAFYFKVSFDAVKKGLNNQVFTYTAGENVISLALKISEDGKGVDQVLSINDKSVIVSNTSQCSDLLLVLLNIEKEYDSYVVNLTIKSTVKNSSKTLTANVSTSFIEFGTFVFPPIKLTIIQVYRVITHCSTFGNQRLYEVEVALQLPTQPVIDFQSILVDSCKSEPPCEFFEINQCTKCAEGFFNENGVCVEKCSNGNFANSETKTCEPCDISCLTCVDSSTNCTSCPDNTYLLNNACVSACPSGTYPSISNECTPCPGDCDTCLNADKCTSCKIGFLIDDNCVDVCPKGTYPQINPNTCVPCDTKCSACTSNTCTECNNGFFLIDNKCVEVCPNKTFPNKDTNKCDNCSDFCDSCQSADICDRCQNGYDLQDDICKTDCSAGSVSINGICVPCDKKCDVCLPNNTSICIVCTAGKFNQNGVCVDECASNQYVDKDGNCKDCSLNCLICTDASTCNKCGPLQVLFNDQCVDVCPNSFVDLNGTCVPCNSDCKTCNSSNVEECITCFEGKLLYNGDCVNVCPDGTYQNGKECTNCLTDCVTCSNGATCNDCKSPKYLKDGKCINDCGDGYTADSSACHPCQVTDCQDCSGNKTTCGRCGKGKVLLNGICISICVKGTYNLDGICQPCNTSCAACNGPVSCTECIDDLLLTKEGNCVNTCPDGSVSIDGKCTDCTNPRCKTCTSDLDTCIGCPDGTFLYNSNCVTECPSKTTLVGQVCVDCHVPCLQCIDTADNCTSCIDTYVLKNSICESTCPDGKVKVNEKCEDCPKNCLNCANPDICDKCQDDKFILDGKCLDSCPSGFYPDGKTCKPCSSNCQLCKCSKNCQICADGFSLFQKVCVENCPDGYASVISEVGRTCQKCTTDCLHCNPNNTESCIECKDGVFLLDNKCVPLCPTGYYTNVLNKTCDKCTTPFCINCDDSKTCKKCDPEKVLLNNTCVDECPAGYKLIATTCEKCVVPHCLVCSDSTLTCNQCVQGFYKLDDTTCVEVCPNGTFPDAITKTCSPCNATCKICNNSNTCVECINGTFLTKNGECVTKCPSGFVEDVTTGKCEPCADKCKECQSNNHDICTLCKSGFYLLGTQCVENCPAGTFKNNDTNTCDTCPYTCTECKSLTECTECKEGLILVDGKCVDTCPEYFVKINGKCAPCLTSIDCLKCCSDNTTKCIDCGVKILFQGRCIDDCPDGYRRLSNNTCEKCADNCKVCTNDTSCDLCLAPFVLKKNGKCADKCCVGFVAINGICERCDDTNCEVCVSDRQCSKCQDGFLLKTVGDTTNCVKDCGVGYYKSSGSCLPCKDLNCLECTNGTDCKKCNNDLNLLLNSQCVTVCPDGMTPKDGYCVVCEAGCLVCSQTINTECLVCESSKVLFNGDCPERCPEKYVRVDDHCENCPENCLVCSSSNNCSTCQTGFVVSPDGSCVTSCQDQYTAINGKCVPCNIEDCSKCPGSVDICKSCVPPKILSFVGDSCLPSCPPGQYEKDGKCQPCSNNCPLCANETGLCIECSTGFFLTSLGTCESDCKVGQVRVGDICKNCTVDHCKNCPSDKLDICNECQNDYVLNNNKCVNQCPNGTFTIDGKICLPCIDNCRTCDDNIDCKVCYSPFVNQDGTCVTECNKGYANVNGQCEECTDSVRCNECNSTNLNECIACKEGFVLNNGICVNNCDCSQFIEHTIKGDVCLPCKEHCKSCSDSISCNRCESPFLLQINECVEGCKDGYVRVGAECKKCSNSLCLVCTSEDQNICVECKDGYVLKDNQCTDNCGLGYFVENKICKPCKDSNCLTCINPGDVCTDCKDNLFVYDGKCVNVCPVGYAADSSDICQKCLDDKCKICQSNNLGSCTDCLNGYLYAEICVTICPQGFYGENNVCLPCLTGCLECTSSSDCRQCKPELKLIDNTCVPECPPKTVSDADGKCVNCKDQDCLICDFDRETCKLCVTPNILKNGQCVDDCGSGFYSDGTNCQKCEPHCIECSSASECKACDEATKLFKEDCYEKCPEYTYPSNGDCKYCTDSEKCRECSSENPAECKDCKSGILYMSVCIESCPDGTYYNSDDKTCKTCEDNCVLCKSGKDCDKCIAGLVLFDNDCLENCPEGYVKVGESCNKCDDNCKTCCKSNQSKCKSCDDGLILFEDKCISQCPAGTFEYTDDNNKTTCKPCGPNCTNCTSFTECKECVDGQVVFEGKCIDNCPSGYVEVGESCVPCADSNCIVCCSLNINNCKQCKDEFILFNKKCIEDCPEGYYANIETNSCDKCDDTCKDCNTSGECTDCKSNLYFSEGTFHCEPCVEPHIIVGSECKTCKVENCDKCIIDDNTCDVCHGTFVLIDGKCVQNCPPETFKVGQECINCGSNCLECSNENNCNKCEEFKVILNGQCVDICPVGYGVNDNHECIECQVPNCEKCDGNKPEKCNHCLSNFSLHDNQCTEDCPPGHFHNDDDTCNDCSDHCLSCVNENNCDVCNDGFYLKDDVCTNDCGEGYFADKVAGTCVPCGVSNCEVCNADSCKKCDDGFFLYDNECIFNCPDGYYKNVTTGECSQCSPGCKNCIDDTSCIVCIDGLVLYEDRCVPVCPLATTKVNNECLPCSDPACEVCTVNNPGSCEKCSSGFLIGTSCVSECPTGFYPDVIARLCLPCDNKCISCSAEDKCNLCKSEFVLENGKCLNNCGEGEFRRNEVCEPCGIDNCLACILIDGNTSCVNCKDKITFNGECIDVCPDGFFEQDKKCLPCATGCLICKSLDECEICKDNLFILKGKCLPGCVDGTYPDCGQPLTCKDCDTACLTCFGEGQSKCKSCANGFFLKGTTCLEELHCQNGYFPNPALNICDKCNLDHCEICADLKSCAICERFYDLKDGACVSNGSIELVYPEAALQTPFAIDYNEIHVIKISDFESISHPANTLSIIAWIRDLGVRFTLNNGTETVFFKYVIEDIISISLLTVNPENKCIIRVSDIKNTKDIDSGFDCSSSNLFKWNLFALSAYQVNGEYKFELYLNGLNSEKGSFEFSGYIINADAKIILLSQTSASSAGSQIAKVSVANYKINKDAVDKFSLNSPINPSWLCDNDSNDCKSGYITLDSEFADLNKEYKLLDLAKLNIYDAAYKSFGINFFFFAQNINSDSFTVFDIVYPYSSSDIKLTYALSLRVDASVSEAKANHNLIVIPSGIIEENKWYIIYASILSHSDSVSYKLTIQDEDLKEVLAIVRSVDSDIKNTVKLYVDSSVIFGCGELVGQVYNPVLFIGDHKFEPKSIEDVTGILTCATFGLNFTCKTCSEYYILDQGGLCVDNAINLGQPLFDFTNSYNHYEEKISIPEDFAKKDFTVVLTLRKLAHSANTSQDKLVHNLLRLSSDSNEYIILNEEISPLNNYSTVINLREELIVEDFGDVDFNFINVAFSYNSKTKKVKVITNATDAKSVFEINGTPQKITLFDELGIEIHFEALNGVIYPKVLKEDDLYSIVNRKLISADPVCQKSDLTTGICKACINKNISEFKCATALYGLSSFQFFGADSVENIKSSFFINSQLKNSVNSSFYAITSRFRIYSVQDIEYRGSGSYNILSLSNDVHLKYEPVNPSLPLLGLFLEVTQGKANLSIRVNNSVSLTTINIDDFEVKYNKWILATLFINTVDKKLEYYISSEDARKHEFVDLPFFTERLQNAGKLTLLDDKIISTSGAIPCFYESINTYVIPNPPTDTDKLVNLLETNDKYKPKPSADLPNCKYSTYDPIKKVSICLVCTGSYTYSNGACVKVPQKKNGYLVLNSLDNIRGDKYNYQLTYPFGKDQLIFATYFRINHNTSDKLKIASLGSLIVSYGLEDSQSFIYADGDKIGPFDSSRFKSFNYIYVFLDSVKNHLRVCVRQCGIPDYSNDDCILSTESLTLPEFIEIDNSSYAIQVFGEQVLQYDYEIPAVDMCNMHNCNADCEACKDGVCSSSNSKILDDGTLAPRFITIPQSEELTFFNQLANKSGEPLRSDNYTLKGILKNSKNGSLIKLNLDFGSSVIEVSKIGETDFSLTFSSVFLEQTAILDISLPSTPANAKLAFIASIINNNKIAVMIYDNKDNYVYKLVVSQGPLSYLTNAASLLIDNSVEDFAVSFSNSVSVENFKDIASVMTKLDQNACLYNNDINNHCTTCIAGYKISKDSSVCVLDTTYVNSLPSNFVNVIGNQDSVKLSYQDIALPQIIERISFVVELEVRLPLLEIENTIEVLTLTGCSGAVTITFANNNLIINNFVSEKQTIFNNFVSNNERVNRFTIAVNLSLLSGATDVFIQKADGTTLNAQSRGKSLLLNKIEVLQLVFGLSSDSTNSAAKDIKYRGNAIYLNSFIDQSILANLVISEPVIFSSGPSYSSTRSDVKDSNELITFISKDFDRKYNLNVSITIPEVSVILPNEVFYAISNFYYESHKDLKQSDILPDFVKDNSYIKIYTEDNTIKASIKKADGNAIYNLLPVSSDNIDLSKLSNYDSIKIEFQVDNKEQAIYVLVIADNVNNRFAIRGSIFEEINSQTGFYFNNKTDNEIDLNLDILDSTPLKGVDSSKSNICESQTSYCSRCEVGLKNVCIQCRDSYSLFRKMECVETQIQVDKLLLN